MPSSCFCLLNLFWVALQVQHRGAITKAFDFAYGEIFEKEGHGEELLMGHKD